MTVTVGRAGSRGRRPSVLLVLAIVWAHAGAAAGQGGGGVVLNEFLASNVFSVFDEDLDSEDFCELYNTGVEEIDIDGYYLSDDPQDIRKWRFPSVTIPPSGYLLVWLSGKDRFVPPPDTITGNTDLAFDAKFIRVEDSWRYLVARPGEAGPPSTWADRDFSDILWPTGQSGFGYGDGDDFTELPDQTNAVFIRRTFEIPRPEQLHNLVLRIDYDDGFVAYLNGRRVAASPSAPPDPLTFESESPVKREAGTAELYDLTEHLDALVAGENVLAVAGLNDLPSSDMSLIPELGVVPLVLHANFRLDREGESLILSNAAGGLVDGLAYPPQTEDHSFGRTPDGSGSWLYHVTPTPNEPNPTTGYSEPIADRIEFSPPPGKQTFAADVTMASAGTASTEIRFTTDGREPTMASTLYTSPVRVINNTVFRAAGFLNGERVTRVVSGSYLYAQGIALPILSISMDPDDYAFVHLTDNGRGRLYERPAFMEYFEASGKLGVATGFGLRLHGGAGRRGDFDTKKAYKAYFRGVYGATKLRYPIIPETPVEEFDKLVLRSGFNDCFRTNGRAAYIRDELIRDLHEDMGALASHGSWCVVYVNTRFRGVYNVVERMDEDFLSSYFEGTDWDVIKTGNDVLVGTIDEWRRLRDFAVGNDLSNAQNFAEVAKMLDIENFTSYMILNMWAQNHDWPHNNWYAARERVPGAKWFMLSWDAEFGIGLIPQGYSEDSFSFTLTRGGYIREIFQALLAYSEYRRYFIKEVDRHVYGVLRPENVLPKIQQLGLVIFPDMYEETAMFGRSITDWQNNLATMRTFANFRGEIFLNLVQRNTQYSFPTLTVPHVLSADRTNVVNVGGVRIRLDCRRVNTSTNFYFGGIRAPGIPRIVGSSQVEVELPFDARLVGPVGVTAENPATGEESTAEGLLNVELPVPVVSQIEPDHGLLDGGERVMVRGRNFLEGVRVFFGESEAASVQRVDGTTGLEVTTPPGQGLVDVRVVNAQPILLESEVPAPFLFHSFRFVRGDANSDGVVDVSDPLATLVHLFDGGRDLDCEQAADADISGVIELTDAVQVLAHLFQHGPPPASPYPDCGDRASEPLSCDKDSCP